MNTAARRAIKWYHVPRPLPQRYIDREINRRTQDTTVLRGFVSSMNQACTSLPNISVGRDGTGGNEGHAMGVPLLVYLDTRAFEVSAGQGCICLPFTPSCAIPVEIEKRGTASRETAAAPESTHNAPGGLQCRASRFWQNVDRCA